MDNYLIATNFVQIEVKCAHSKGDTPPIPSIPFEGKEATFRVVKVERV